MARISRGELMRLDALRTRALLLARAQAIQAIESAGDQIATTLADGAAFTLDLRLELHLHPTGAVLCDVVLDPLRPCSRGECRE